jgi:hypothetical protein
MFLSSFPSKSSSVKQAIASSSLAPSTVLAPSSGRSITPNNPGSFKTHQFMETITRSKPYSEMEAIAMESLEQRASAMAAATERTYLAAEKISNSQVKIHKAYEGYRQAEGKNEYQIVESKAKTAATLQSLRPGYHRLGEGMQRIEAVVNSEINASIAAFG